jgi:hypothetical protein
MATNPVGPSLDGLDDVSCVHDAMVDAAGVLAEPLSQLGTATDAVHAAHAIGHLATHAQKNGERN